MHTQQSLDNHARTVAQGVAEPIHSMTRVSRREVSSAQGRAGRPVTALGFMFSNLQAEKTGFFHPPLTLAYDIGGTAKSPARSNTDRLRKGAHAALQPQTKLSVCPTQRQQTAGNSPEDRSILAACLEKAQMCPEPRMLQARPSTHQRASQSEEESLAATNPTAEAATSGY